MFRSLRRRAAAAIVSLTGVVLLCPPLYDVWTDWQAVSKPLWSTLVENSVGLVLAAVLASGGLWLYRRDWEDAYVTDAALWVVAIIVGHAVVIAWILAIQRFVQHDLKPYVIAMDGVVLSADVALGIGIYDARTQRQQDELGLERDRLAALYENSADAIATVRFDDGAIVEASNDAFEEWFDGNVERVLAVVPESGAMSLRERLATGEDVEYEWNGGGNDRNYRVTVTPVEEHGEVRAHVRVADITEEQRLAREREARERVEHLHRVASDLAAAETAGEAFERTLNALHSVVAFDDACLVVDGELVADRSAGSVLDPGGVERVQSGAVPTDGGAATRTTDDGRTVLTVPVGSEAALQASVDADSLREWQVTAAELLGTHLRETRRRLDREDRLHDQRERLELLNRTFRHDLLNDTNVIEARAAILDGHVDDEFEEHRATIDERAGEMNERIQSMRSLMQAVEGDAQELAAVPLAATLKAEVDAARERSRSAAFEVETPLPDVDVRADDLLGDVFENLLANAVTHNDSDAPHVRVSAERHGDSVDVTVADNGPGVPDGERDAVFDLGEKGEESGGTGVGLNLCARIVDSYGGDVTIDESALGGAAFVVTLPVAA